jgi:hypothetical protein
MPRSLFPCAFTILLLVLCGCNAPGVAMQGDVAAVDDVGNGLVAEPSPAVNPLAGAFYSDAGDGDGLRGRSVDSQAAAGAPQATTAQRMLIQRGEIRVEVARPEDVAREFVAKVGAWGGYLHSQQGTTLVVRVPAPHFDDAFAAARALGRVLGESRQANDVTEEFVDLGIRIDTARKARERLLEVLQKAEKVEDILKVEVELRRLTEEIERMEGRRKVLADQVTLATLQVQLFAVAPPPPPPKQSRQASRFGWINRVGAEATMGDF